MSYSHTLDRVSYHTIRLSLSLSGRWLFWLLLWWRFNCASFIGRSKVLFVIERYYSSVFHCKYKCRALVRRLVHVMARQLGSDACLYKTRINFALCFMQRFANDSVAVIGCDCCSRSRLFITIWWFILLVLSRAMSTLLK